MFKILIEEKNTKCKECTEHTIVYVTCSVFVLDKAVKKTTENNYILLNNANDIDCIINKSQQILTYRAY